MSYAFRSLNVDKVGKNANQVILVVVHVISEEVNAQERFKSKMEFGILVGLL